MKDSLGGDSLVHLFSLPATPLGNVEECYRYFISVLFCHGVRVSSPDTRSSASHS